MGCGSSQATQVAAGGAEESTPSVQPTPDDGDADAVNLSSVTSLERTGTDTVTEKSSDLDAMGDHPAQADPTELQGAVGGDPGEGGQPVAFEVPANPSIVKKHPPKRLMKLEDQQALSITHETIEEKQAEAERRRKEILNNRVQSAKKRTSQQSARSRSRPATAGSAGGSDISGGEASDHEDQG